MKAVLGISWRNSGNPKTFRIISKGLVREPGKTKYQVERRAQCIPYQPLGSHIGIAGTIYPLSYWAVGSWMTLDTITGYIPCEVDLEYQKVYNQTVASGCRSLHNRKGLNLSIVIARVSMDIFTLYLWILSPCICNWPKETKCMISCAS